MQAVILAAGMGKRLKELTRGNTKCMVKVNGITLIERMLRQLDSLNLEKIIIVVGYKGKLLVDFTASLNIRTNLEYVDNPIYDKTNNIYSLYLAKDYLEEDDTLLLESDLIFDDAALHKIHDDPHPNLTLVAKYESWMDGTVVTLGGDEITSFLDKKNFKFSKIKDYYKTVNIYKFSKEFSHSHYIPFLKAYSKALGDNEYYEQVLKVITLLDKPEIKAIKLKNEAWYEIDDIQDLDIAESLFSSSAEDKLEKFQNRYGGYWRYPKLIDFCYLVNPFFPSSKLKSEMKANFDRLLADYPSGMRVNSLLAAKYFGIQQEQICIGNGAAELIKSAMNGFTGKIGIQYPTFEEYPNRIDKERIVPYYAGLDKNYRYDSDQLIDFYSQNKVQNVLLINPDNPSGNYIPKNEIMKLVNWTKSAGIRLIVDESFIDFAENDNYNTLLDQAILDDNPHLIVIKSISKSYGVPGIRLGILASGNRAVIETVKKDVSIWNINSFGEFFMQIIQKYKGDYLEGIQKFKITRKDFIKRLSRISGIRLLASDANYIMIEVLQGTAYELTRDLLSECNIFIKDLSPKKGVEGEYIRVAIRGKKDNKALVKALKGYFLKG